MKKRNKKQTLETLNWEDVFYIIDINDSEIPHRKNYSVEEDGHFYNLCLMPNTIRPDSRHYCLACGMDLDKIYNVISRYVSSYRDIYTMYEAMDNITDGCRCTKISLQQKDEYWEEFGTEYTSQYDNDIKKAIERGFKTHIYSGSKVKVKYNEEEDELEIKGYYTEWFEEFVEKCMNFKGHTKQELYDSLSDDIDITCMNEIFSGLKAIGCFGIKQMKKLNMYRWIDVLVPLVNEWEFDEDYYNEE